MNSDKERRDYFFNNIQEDLLHLIECGRKQKALSLFEVYYSRIRDSYRKARKNFKKAKNPFTKDSCEKDNGELISTALLYAESLYYYSYYLNKAGDNLKAVLCLKHVIKLFEALPLPDSESKEIYYKAKVDRINYLLSEGQLQKAENEVQRLLKDFLNLEGNIDSLNYDLVFDIYNAIIGVYFCMRRVKEAESIIKGLLDNCLKNSEENKQSTLLRGNLAIVLKCQDRFQEAIAEGQKYLDGCKNFFGNDSDQTIKAKKIQADICFCAGRISEFGVLSKEIVRKLTDDLGVDHPETLNYMNEAAYAFLVNEEYEEALEWLEEAAKYGHKGAQFNLGKLYYEGIGGKQDYDQAFEWLKKSAEGEDGEPMAQVYLGVLYADGKGVDKNTEEAFKWFKKAAELGESSAQLNLGLMYMNGALVEKNYEEALFWVRKSAEQGDSDAQTVLGKWYYEETVVKQDYHKALEWFEKAAKQDNAGALYMLGSMYYHGIGVGQNHDKAFEYFEKATKQDYQNCSEAFKKDYIEAKYNLGVMYIYGEGTRKNRKEGLRLIKEAAELGNVNAQKALGEWHFNGSHVKKDLGKAFHWVEKAAKQGDADAQNIVSALYLEGVGVKQNTKKAVEWAKKAAKQGHELAINALKSLNDDGAGEE